MSGNGDGVGPGQPALQFVGEQQVGELGLPVRAHAAVAALGLQIVEADAAEAVAVAADGHHP